MIIYFRNGKTNLNPRRAKGLAQTSKADAEPGGADYRRAKGNVHQLGIRQERASAFSQRGDAEKDQIIYDTKTKTHPAVRCGIGGNCFFDSDWDFYASRIRHYGAFSSYCRYGHSCLFVSLDND